MNDEESPKIHPMPFTRVEVVVFTLKEGELTVLLGRRAAAPFAGRWAIPGGVVKITEDATLADSARRVIRERLQTELPNSQQVGTVGGAKRDPRAWSMSVVYRAQLPVEGLDATAGKRLEEIKWFSVEEAIGKLKLAFDHGALLTDALQSLRAEIALLSSPIHLLGDGFTLTELQQACEAVLGHALEKSSFRRRLKAAELVEPIPGGIREGSFRPAQTYAWRQRTA
jgi:8-oxo-dGTP diphosphatase